LIWNYPSLVKLASSDAEKYPLPSRQYLEIHAACAKVAHLSGAGKYLDRMYQAMEDAEDLSDDEDDGSFAGDDA
jgi:hypothetical protein